MDDLITWLRQRLADDEQAAKAALQYDPAPWEASTSDSRPTNAERNGEDVPPDSGWIINARRENLWDDEGCLAMGAATASHIARHDPAAVLADVVAKKAILELHDQSGVRWTGFPRADRQEPYCIHDQQAAPCDTVRLLVSAYRHRPGWRQEWEA